METITTRQAAERIARRIGRSDAIPTSTMHSWITDRRLKPLTKLDGLRGAYLFDAEHVDDFADALVADSQDGAA